MNMTATYNAQAKTKFTTSHRKEGKCWFEEYAIITADALYVPAQGPAEASKPITLRLYGTGAKNFACLWVNTHGLHTSGSGSAGGYGYCRKSAAADEAISNAGFTLSKNIHGVGESAIKEALGAIAEAIGLSNYYLVTAHA
jgi:hypothetical protein